jgi:hypothetical protein
MGTRSVTIVVHKEEIRIAQYGQWDGYPQGQGRTVLNFCKNLENLEKLRYKLDTCVLFIDLEIPEHKTQALAYDMNCEDHCLTPEQQYWESNFWSRDVGAGLLYNIIEYNDDLILINNQYEFINDSSCEWWYLIDLDKMELEVHHYNLNVCYDINMLLKEIVLVE